MAGKMLFGTNKLGRQKRILKCNPSTFDGCEWMPNFKGSQRGCVLKVSNDYLTRFGVKKRSQVDAINGIDHSNHGFKKILKIINENLKSGQQFTVTFMTSDVTVKTVEIFFRGAFCPSVEFCAEGDGTNFIIENIPYDSSTKKLIENGELKCGWRVTKVKSSKVIGKKYEEISKMILSASNDMRIDYSVVFEEGDMSWYNFEEPPPEPLKKKHERKGSGRWLNTKRKNKTNNLKKKSGRHARGSSKGSTNKKNGHKYSSSMSLGFDIASIDFDDLKDGDMSGAASDGNMGGKSRSPSFSSLASVTEDKLSFDTFELTDDNVVVPVSPAKRPMLQVIHSGGHDLVLNHETVAAVVSDGNSPFPPTPTTAKSKSKTKKSVNFNAAVGGSGGGGAVTVANIPIVTIPAIKEVVNVNVSCDLCGKLFVIKDNELEYHSLCQIAVENEDEKVENGQAEMKYNGLCVTCLNMECVVELNKFDAITLAPHESGHCVCICYVDVNIHKYLKWIIVDKDRKEKKIKDKNLKIGLNFIILAINNINVEHESFEVIFAMYYQQKKSKKVRLKLRKHFTATHLKIVTAYHTHTDQLLALQRQSQEKQKADLAKKALLTRNTNKTMIDSDPSDEDSVSEEEEYTHRPSSTRSSKRSKSRPSKHRRKKSAKNIRLSHTSNDYEFSDYGAAEEHKSVSQLIEEHDGMVFIHEAEKLEADGQWELAAITYEKGVHLLDDYQKLLQLSTREKRAYRQELAEYRRKMLLVQNRLIRKSNTPRSSKQDKDKEKEREQKEKDKEKEKEEGDDEEAGNNKKKEKINDADKAFRDRLMGDIITEAPNVSFKDVTGLLNVKLALYECVILPQKRPELFTGLRKPAAGLLLFGPPGNGKTMIAKCVATECDATFFSISASSITSKYVGEAERIMRTLFNMAREKQPSIIFIDEIDSLLTARGGNNEAESSRRIKTEFLVQFDGVKATADGKDAHVLIIGATNLPEQLDEAVLRRFGKRILVPVPDEDARYGILRNLTSQQKNNLNEENFKKIVQRTNLYSASDLTQVCKDASMGPLRDLGTSILDMDNIVEVGPIELKHFEAALKNVRASVKQESLMQYQKWNKQFGSKLTFELSALPTNMHAHPIQPLE